MTPEDRKKDRKNVPNINYICTSFTRDEETFALTKRKRNETRRSMRS